MRVLFRLLVCKPSVGYFEPRKITGPLLGGVILLILPHAPKLNSGILGRNINLNGRPYTRSSSSCLRVSSFLSHPMCVPMLTLSRPAEKDATVDTPVTGAARASISYSSLARLKQGRPFASECGF